MARFPVRLAYVGVGGYSGATFEGSSDKRLFDIRGIYDIDPGIARVKASKYGCRVYGNFADILADTDVDGVVFTLPPDQNRRQVEQAAAAGKHCYVAKPIAVTVRDGRAMDEACRKAGRILMVGHDDRRRAEVRHAKRLIDEGAIGTPVLFEGNISHMGGWELSPRSWRADRSRCPVVPLVMLGIHVLESMCYLLGPAVSVSALHKRVAMPVDNEDVAVQIYALASGAAAYVGNSYVSPPSYWMRVHGTTASLLIERKSLTVLDTAGTASPVSLIPSRPEVELMEEFARAIVEGTAIETGAVPSLRALACMEAALLSARSGKREQVEEIEQIEG